ncbi:hypothetical protein HOLleu_34315 [Holothuria leucospilota]|uniref:Dynein heavy chain hydrolytic ATP-binding dynein motor region domain-containing protein n=1 Tax=Holothuria leucospilota TaxID=206669 RepID=A0A9Q0YKZ8_HOLLE|nr:hypothetical protein HOLleu_34315 [Holothuria leucospilota]
MKRKSLMRPTYMMSPEVSVILETTLICSGFQEHQGLASKLCSFARILAAQFPDKPEFHLDLRVMKSLVDVAALRIYSKRNLYELAGRGSSLNGSTPTSTTTLGMVADQVGALSDSDLMNALEQDDLHKEENAIVFAIQLHLLTRLSNQDQQQRVRDLLRCVFPWSGGGARPSTGGHEHDPVLVDAIQSQFVADKLQATPQHVNKVCRFCLICN